MFNHDSSSVWFAWYLASSVDKVKLDEMIFDDTDGGSFSHECRCGEVYSVTSAELREGFEVLDCRGCSLYIRVLGTPEEESKAPPAASRR